MKSKTLPLHQDSDPPGFEFAIHRCKELGLKPVRCTDYQVKAGPWNFYTNGTFFMDGDKQTRGKGFGAFTQALDDWDHEPKVIFI